MKITFEDIIFWIFILIIIGTSIWLLSGSPPEIDALITIGIAVAGSEILIWKNMFESDKKSSLGFMKVRHDMEKIRIEINNRFNTIDNQLLYIKNKLDTRTIR